MTALPVVGAALSSMATFTEAGVSTRSVDGVDRTAPPAVSP
ncbi:nicotinate-nucleotide--dimethylbenzimidazole phosphoribosyltransferase [Mycobacterium tuberculosis]|nr:nicotinate-nucleotide--dimethylbenzimidazole phosphoribosyltransferase [Mycobacterium tuberculosis]